VDVEIPSLVPSPAEGHGGPGPGKTDMALKRMDNVLVVVEDIDAVIAFFVELGMELEDRQPVEGAWVDQVIAIAGSKQEIAMLRSPDGNGRIELAMFHTPAAIRSQPTDAPANTLGLRRIMFAVDDIDEVVARLTALGGELVGEVARYGDAYRLCYLRGPEGIVVGLAEELG
jgi:catechol 2,3-dioxygenase-like lactoylglutathione lyase family enzyme